MKDSYYKPCRELDICNDLIEKYFNKQQYKKCFDGQYNLAWFYENGVGVEHDKNKSIFWYCKAALQGHKQALEKCKELGIKLNV